MGLLPARSWVRVLPGALCRSSLVPNFNVWRSQTPRPGNFNVLRSQTWRGPKPGTFNVWRSQPWKLNVWRSQNCKLQLLEVLGLETSKVGAPKPGNASQKNVNTTKILKTLSTKTKYNPKKHITKNQEIKTQKDPKPRNQNAKGLTP